MAYATSRQRTIYQSEALFVGPTPATGQHFDASGNNLLLQIDRVQSANHNLKVPRVDVPQFGQLAAIDRVILESPTVTLDFSYLIRNVLPEQSLGLVVNGQSGVLTNIINATQDEKNYFILETPEGTDANFGGDGNFLDNGVHGIGNGYISNLSWEAQVGQFPKATVQIEGFNYKTDIASSGNSIPAINKTNGLNITGYTYAIPTVGTGVGVSVLKPGDITMNFSGSLGYLVSDLKLQSFNLSLPIAREPIQKLGSRFAFARVIRFPINASMQVNAVVGVLQADNLANVLCNDVNYTLSVTLALPSCSGNGAPAVIYTMYGAKLDSQNATANVGGNNSISLTFTSPLGGPNDSVHNCFISGILS